MSLLDTLRSAVAVANKVTKPLQPSVQHRAWKSQDRRGKVTYASVVSRQCVWERLERLIRTTVGGQVTEVLSRHRLTFVGDVTVDTRDKITLPDGSSGPILDVSSFPDAATGGQIVTQVWLG